MSEKQQKFKICRQKLISERMKETKCNAQENRNLPTTFTVKLLSVMFTDNGTMREMSQEGERYVEELSSSDEQSEGEDEYYNEPVQDIDNLSNEDNHFVTQVSQILQKELSCCIGPTTGAFAVSLLKYLFQKLFTADDLRVYFSYKDGGKLSKRPLDDTRKQYLRRYVTAFYPSTDKHDSDDEEDDGSSPAVTREAIKTAVDSLLRSRNEKNPISTTPLVAAKPQQTSYEYDSQKVQQQPCENQSQQNESCVPVTQLSQQNKWHDIPVHQQLSQQNPLQIPLLILRESY
ncbi:unnamed protein product [Mytilus edulis]|uniref:BEN domain-containing protein n=1 Tax=Mytilus edulis TaxID=6550 RepID=A0A8S3RJG3_MYTED|nr:unnamed protein product [Mytilus edulis]